MKDDIYPRYFVNVLTIDGEGDYDAMEFEREGYTPNQAKQFCLANDGSYEFLREQFNVCLSLETYYFSTEIDRNTAEEALRSVHETLQTYDRSKGREIYFLSGCYKSDEEEQKDYEDAEIAFNEYEKAE